DYQSVEGEIENEGVRLGDTICPASGYEESPTGLQGESDDRVLRTSVVSQAQGAQACPTNPEGDEESSR
ncbi:hypothetical protein A2U01_0085224, partial [Trifolium medium]|nr:hypothetical protein [Trifolium medium]